MGGGRSDKKNRNIADRGNWSSSQATTDFESDAIAMPIAAGEKEKRAKLWITTLYKSAKMYETRRGDRGSAGENALELFGSCSSQRDPENRRIIQQRLALHRSR